MEVFIMLRILTIVELILVSVFGYQLWDGTNMTVFIMSGLWSAILGCLLMVAFNDPEKEEA